MSLRFRDKTGDHTQRDAVASSEAHTTSRIAILILEAYQLSEAASVAETWQFVNDALSWSEDAAHRYDVHVLSTETGSVACTSSIRLYAENIDEYHPRLFKAIFVASGITTFEPQVIDWLSLAGPDVELIAISSEAETLLAHVRPSSEDAASRAVAQNARSVPTIERVLAIAERDFGTPLRIRSEMLRAKLPSTRGDSKTANNRGTFALSERIETSVLWIKSNHAGWVSISELARRASMSERNFLRRFKAEVGQTPREYLARVRLENAQLLLVQTDLPMDTVAKRCGLVNGDHLSRHFLKYLSTSPLEYRARVRECPMTGAAVETINTDACAV